MRLRAEESQLEDELLLEQESSRDRVTRSRSPIRSWEQELRHDPDAESLLRVWNRTGTTGRGREILERREEVSEGLLAFLGTRMPRLPIAKKFASKNEKKEKRGKTLNYERESKDMRESVSYTHLTLPTKRIV